MTPPPDSSGSFDRMPYKQTATNGPGFLKPGRALPPRVDTSAASKFMTARSTPHTDLSSDRPYIPPDQLTPVSASTSRSLSPITPSGSDGRRSPFGRPPRSATAPINRPAPSPDSLSSNLDCAFPPFPAPKQGKSQGSYGSLGASRYGENDPMYAPVSPRTASSGGLLQRMNTIAPGPFDVNNRRNVGGSGGAKGQGKQVSTEITKDMNTPATEAESSITRPSTAGPGHSRTSTNSSNESKSEITVPKLPRKNGYGGFGPPENDDSTRREFLTAESRSATFPLQNESQEESFRRPSEPDTGSRGRNMSSDDANTSAGPPTSAPNAFQPRRQKPSMSGPDLTRPLPPRGASLIRPREDLKANLNLAAEFGIGNPYHTPSESQSSDASGYSDQSKASSRSSPPLSTGPSRSRSPRRKLSSDTRIDSLTANLESSMSELQPRDTSSSRSPPRQRDQYPRPLQPPQKLEPSLLSPESPMDPSIQQGRLSPVPQNRNRSPSPSRTTPPNERVRRPSTAPKGNCKGCREPIKGKSVSSADGRLTGRYHKQCFVCNTCSEPFQTATFYVIKDAPYCERHYHKLNGSICTTCDKGIEGQYLESERKQKFHPNCLTCADCRRNLKHDYFEMNGRVYCERDAFRRTQQQQRFLGPGMGGTSRMERRTTRLMMM